jgi:hypothetical protein
MVSVHGEERLRQIKIRMDIMGTGDTSNRELPSTRASHDSLCRRAASFRRLRTAVRRSSSHQGTSYQVAGSRASNYRHVVGSQAVI